MNIKLALSYFFIFYSHKFNDTSGRDERTLSPLDDPIETQSIYELNCKKNLLELLKSKYVNIYDKMDKIDQHTSQIQTNILNGGFLDDW
jgi:hypothetical protein